MDAVRLVSGYLGGSAFLTHLRDVADFFRRRGRDPRKIAFQARAYVAGSSIAEHLHEDAEFHAVRVRFDFGRVGRHLLGHAIEDVLGAVLFFLRGDVGETSVGIGEGDLPDIGIHGVLAPAVGPLEFDLDPRPVVLLPGNDLVRYLKSPE